jgi:UDP-2,3-diacylglucosamine hydrolase
LSTGTNIYFASDLHLGAPNAEDSLRREKLFVQWLNEIGPKASEIFLVGDIFDFWYEYRHVIPKGYVRLLGKLAELADRGVKLHFFTGNHDLWYSNYFEQQLGASIHHTPVIREFFGRTFYIAHGDGLGPGDHGYKLLKKVLTNRLSRFLFTLLHPDWGVSLANFFSRLSRNHNYHPQEPGAPEPHTYGEQEFLYIHSRQVLENQPDIDYFIYGHRHIIFDRQVGDKARCLILGDWLSFFSYLEASEAGVTLKRFPLRRHA